MSSVETWVRPCNKARALAPRIKNCTAPRTRSPTESLGDEVGHPGLAYAGLADQRQHIAYDVVRDGHLAYQPLQVQDLFGREHRRDVLGESAGRAPCNFELLVEARIADEHLNMKRSCLRLGQRVGAFLLDRVLGRQHEERVRQLVPNPAHRDLAAPASTPATQPGS